MTVLFLDKDQPENRPLCRFDTIFTWRNGILSPLERELLAVQASGEDQNFFYSHPQKDFAKIVGQSIGSDFPSASSGYETISQFVETHPNTRVVESPSVISSLELLPSILESDKDLWIQSNPGARNGKIPAGCHIVGDAKDLWISSSANILPGCVFDTRKGSIILDEQVEISSFTYIEGPAYIGRNAKIDNARITGACSIGRECRIGGEVENSIFQDFSNKHHEGFIGHSVVGRWVNLGALSTTSDLKNNYGEVKLQLPDTFVPSNTRETLNTGTIKFGSIIGDTSKIAIGTMLNTGSVIDVGCNIFEGCNEKYYPPLTWGRVGNRYNLERYLSDCEKIFKRRNQSVNPNMTALLQLLISS